MADQKSTTPGTVSTPDVSMFYFSSGRGDGWASKLIRELQVDVPVQVIYPAGTKMASALSGLSQAAKRLEVPVAIRTVDGVPWVMRKKTAEKEPVTA